MPRAPKAALAARHEATAARMARHGARCGARAATVWQASAAETATLPAAAAQGRHRPPSASKSAESQQTTAPAASQINSFFPAPKQQPVCESSARPDPHLCESWRATASVFGNWAKCLLQLRCVAVGSFPSWRGQTAAALQPTRRVQRPHCSLPPGETCTNRREWHGATWQTHRAGPREVSSGSPRRSAMPHLGSAAGPRAPRVSLHHRGCGHIVPSRETPATGREPTASTWDPHVGGSRASSSNPRAEGWRQLANSRNAPAWRSSANSSDHPAGVWRQMPNSPEAHAWRSSASCGQMDNR